jgi:hypothetical protein
MEQLEPEEGKSLVKEAGGDSNTPTFGITI